MKLLAALVLLCLPVAAECRAAYAYQEATSTSVSTFTPFITVIADCDPPAFLIQIAIAYINANGARVTTTVVVTRLLPIAFLFTGQASDIVVAATPLLATESAHKRRNLTR